ncbi:16S rRNA m(7)G-527 methyltransferase [Gallaecimonas pentaromativorans]|uniref:Ribosomal RNA small subunit methyltransferase G n=1 Tax=Gallaecimonas pentaromativorans TaxID=584787 RepID=A0A3N1NSM2_9GAMM|nr:16S rRNA (guanine(527)-N(7))-methyltransferase RsmG [Gallaecimonas pentaromativorans]ROQ19143.1 16S rRNA m(7)G-527 methyltransferase [Gallaecimonas pentaromativorans]
MLRKRLDQLLAETSLEVTGHQRELLVKLVEQLDKWNKAYNLTSVRDPLDMVAKHIVDSLVVSPYLPSGAIIDVGTGPGLPGLPLAIINPDKTFVLLDSLGKRIRFIRQTCHELGISNVTAIQSRVEEHQPEQPYAAVVSRAFASIQDMLSWCGHLTDHRGAFLAMKGLYPEEELNALPENIEVRAVYPLAVPGLDGQRHLIALGYADTE